VGKVVKTDTRFSIVSFALSLAFSVAITLATVGSAAAGSDLKLAPGLSFDDDSSTNFPIRGQGMADASTPLGEATIMFFGTSNCWNTAREAERLVELYPTIAVIDSQGKLMYDGAGETATTRGDTSNLQRLLDSAR